MAGRTQPSAPSAPAVPRGEPCATHSFDALADLLDETTKPALWPDAPSSDKPSEDWNGRRSLAQARDMLAGAGSPELADKVRAVMVDMVPRANMTLASGAAWDVSGAIVDVERYLAGDPECMLDLHSPCGERRTLDVWVSLAASSAFSAQQIIERGAAVCAMIDATERAGVRCRVYWCVTCTNGPGNLLPTLHGMLKDYAAPLDVDLMAFALAHPAMFRRIIFKVMERQPAYREACERAYGQPAPTKVPEGAVYVPGMDTRERELWDDSLKTVQAAFERAGE